MSQNRSLHPLTQQLNIGNIINVSINLYRANLKQYFSLSFRAYLWLFIPLYGWAKFLVISALISRLTFSALMDKPENVREARRFINSRSLSFVLLTILAGILLLAVFIISIYGMGFFVITTGAERIISSLGDGMNGGFARNNILIALFFMFLLLLFLLSVLAGMFVPFLWFYSRLFIVELPLALEDNIDSIKALWRSWRLTKGYFVRIQLVLIIVMFLLLPLEILLYALGEVIEASTDKLLTNLFASSPWVDTFLVETLRWGIILLNAVMLMPLFQAIKAVVYYNLRLRREGLGLMLRDRTKRNPGDHSI